MLVGSRRAHPHVRNGYPNGKATSETAHSSSNPCFKAQSLGLHRDTQGLVASGLVTEVDCVAREQTWAGCIIADGWVYRALVHICLD